jgi:hypothetical protein
MAYPDSDWGASPVAEAGAPVSTAARWLGALSSAALLAGLAVWAWDLATRDARTVPVVRAMEGQARVAPEDPGGFEAAHQGYEVNKVASEAEAEPLADRVVLAPEAVGPSEEDLSAAEPPESSASGSDALRSAVEGALTEVLGTQAPPNPGSAAQETAPPATDMPRPRKRPDMDIATRAATSPTSQALAPAEPDVIAASEIPAGTRLVQLGSFDSAAAAEDLWRALAADFAPYFDERARVVEKAEYAGEPVWRLRAHGFADLPAARNFCAVLIAADKDCIPVLTR